MANPIIDAISDIADAVSDFKDRNLARDLAEADLRQRALLEQVLYDQNVNASNNENLRQTLSEAVTIPNGLLLGAAALLVGVLVLK